VTGPSRVDQPFWRALLVIFGLVFAGNLARSRVLMALPLTISVETDSKDWSASAKDGGVLVRLPPHPDSGSLTSETGSSRPIEVPSTVTLDLPAHSRWDIALESDQVWAPQISDVDVDREPS
jgi:hypothetical protein